MPTPVLTQIYRCPVAGAPMQHVTSVEAITGRGLLGDRYERAAGTYSKFPGPHDITLFEMESLWDFERYSGIVLHPAQTRRNLITEGAALAELIDQEFTIGSVRFRGSRLCPPCLYLAQLLKLPIFLKGFARSGGIYATILDGGILHAGDTMQVA